MPDSSRPLRKLGFLTIGLFDPADPAAGHESTLQIIGLGERLGFDLYPYTEDQVAAVRRSVEQWNFIDGVAGRIDDGALAAAQKEKDAVRAYELVYAALGA